MEKTVVKKNYAHAITSWEILAKMEKHGSVNSILQNTCVPDVAREWATRLWQEAKKQDEEDREEQQKDELQQEEEKPMDIYSSNDVGQEVV